MNSSRVLIVEDDPSWQQILAEVMGDSGLIVDIAGSLEEALPAIQESPHRVAVLDLSLETQDPHNQDGLHVLEALRLKDPGCAAILLTGYATVELAVRAVTELGAVTCLRKETFQRAHLRELIGRIMTSAPNLAGNPIEPSKLALSNTDLIEANHPAGLALVVEDDAGWRSILSELLAEIGLQVRLCHSFGEALGCLRREKYSLALVDLSLGGVSAARIEKTSSGMLEGYRLLASTRAAGIPTLVVSGVATTSDIESIYSEQEIFAFIQKQAFHRGVFLQTVREALAYRPPLEGLGGLTSREREVLTLLAQGLTNKEIADALVISTNTVKRHLKAIFDKLDVHTRSAAAARALENRSEKLVK